MAHGVCIWAQGGKIFNEVSVFLRAKVLKKRIIFSPICQIKHSDTENLS